MVWGCGKPLEGNGRAFKVDPVHFWEWEGIQAWEEGGEMGCWSPRFSRHLHDWGMGEVESLLWKLQPLAVRRDAEDILSWQESRNGFFLFIPFIVPTQGLLVILSHGALFGGLGTPMRVSLFAWEASWNRILTCDQLKRRGWNLPNRCYLCKQEEETNDHLFLGNLLGWHGSFVGKRREKAWKAAHLRLMWTLWKERHGRAFNDVERGWLSSHFAA
ncbi:hypothetical protein CK203_022361 [Vitis vinifera]|uniref:Reverse transcriptase zinc-binding domain-containing protein n=1 Tax=Vitis vinifera TaxID=29760 RepID=A0A438I941_VITVI|nr:hypothetical protein CK203_022361 [Vitis vinifera]